jgi:hypothetical protein
MSPELKADSCSAAKSAHGLREYVLFDADNHRLVCRQRLDPNVAETGLAQV